MSEHYSEARDPYTYAYDYLREEVGDPNISRAQMAAIVRTICESHALDKWPVAYSLATAFMRKHGITRP